MQAGDKVGPFVVEKEIGSGAMGAVYRAIYTKTRQKVAIKLMMPGLATSPQAEARFEREATILKQFNHPNIVRLFGVGKHAGSRYYAMEYIQGEGLDKVMSRRGRMTWEEVVTLGQQLCAALQHAHDQGIIHRDLKPSNIMVLPDGTLKLTDFGIAKDMDLTQLTETNCTVGTAAYMSPEQCKGERNLRHKSDLYSMGVLLYELVTGKKPFYADNAMDMFMQHVQGTFERPSRLVLDIPVWLDNLICQLLEKNPDQRPLDADMVSNTLGSIKEKVEAQHSAGVDAVRQRRIDRPKGERGADTEDAAAARTLLGKKPRKKRKKVPFFEQVWLKAAGLVLLLAGVVTAIVLFLRPPAPEKLYKQAEELMASTNPEDWDRAERGPIANYLQHYASRPGPETDKMREWLKDIRYYENEDLLKRLVSKKRRSKPFETQGDAQLRGLAAAWKEDEGDVKGAREIWLKMAQDFGPGSSDPEWGDLAARRLKMLATLKDEEDKFRSRYDDIMRLGAPPPIGEVALLSTEQQKDAFAALRYEWFGDPFVAQDLFEKMQKKYLDDSAQRFWYLFAANKNQELKEKLDKDKGLKEKDNRTKNVEQELQKAKGKIDLSERKGICINIIDLYEGDDEMKQFVEEARKYK